MAGESILVVEDDGLVALDILSQLNSMGYPNVRTAASAQTALAEVDRFHPDLALLDVNILGEVDGITLGDELRTQREIPIVYMTAATDAETVRRASLTLPNGYLQKPIHGEELRLMVRLALEEGKVERARRAAREAERERERQSMELRQMNAVATLTSGLAHELNNALQVTMGNITLASGASNGDQRVLGHLSLANDSCIRSANLIQQLLGFAQRGAFWPENVDILTEVSEAVQSLRFEIRDDVNLVITPESRNLTVSFDRAQLRNIVANVLMNALDAMPSGGRVDISVSESCVDAPRRHNTRANPGRFIVLRIADTGHGIEEQHLERLFEPFFSTRPRYERKGLGLSVAYGVMQRHGGWVTVTSEKDVGTTVELWFSTEEPTV